MNHPRNENLYDTHRKRKIILRKLFCKRMVFRVCYMVIAGTGIGFHAMLERCIGKTPFDWTLIPGCFITDVVISIVQTISIAFGNQKDEMDVYYNVFLMILYILTLDCLMNNLNPDENGSFNSYRMITESIVSAVGFLIHFGEIILNWICEELGMDHTQKNGFFIPERMSQRPRLFSGVKISVAMQTSLEEELSGSADGIQSERGSEIESREIYSLNLKNSWNS